MLKALRATGDVFFGGGLVYFRKTKLHLFQQHADLPAVQIFHQTKLLEHHETAICQTRMGQHSSPSSWSPPFQMFTDVAHRRGDATQWEP